MRLGTCYYPEHWPADWWADDARRMAEMGLTRVRIAEFAWSRIEPEPGRFDWGWLDRAIDTLAAEGLGIILCTPTATPPKWLVDRMPDMLAIGADGQPRRFGSRRHYCFSHRGYRAECARITRALAERYGAHPAIVAWQTDNEFGCHDTVLSYSAAAASNFRAWLEQRHGTIAALNLAWGTVFWSQEYRSFAEIDPPIATVTEAHPAHRLDWRRFASDEVTAFNALQVEILRAASPGRDVLHNFMGFFTEFDHHRVASDLDLVGWDSYPLGFLEQFWFSEADKLRYRRQGHPDIAAFHHDLYRGCTPGGRWCVIEQQPGPVNWAAYNPAPLPGMVRLWTLEALAHGAELVAYFRWRQAPFGQEQLHAGLHRPDRSQDLAADEVRQAGREIAALGAPPTTPARVALLFSYEAIWTLDIQPQGASFNPLELTFRFYSALRRLGLDVDIIPSSADLTPYALVVAPSLPMVAPDLLERLVAFDGQLVFGPRSGSRTVDFAIPPELPPGPLETLIPLKVVRVESLRPGATEQGEGFIIERWIETIQSDLAPDISTASGRGIVYRCDRTRYLAAWPDEALLGQLLAAAADDAGLATTPVPADLRLRRSGGLCFAFNHGPDPITLDQAIAGRDVRFLVGQRTLAPADVAVWQVDAI